MSSLQIFDTKQLLAEAAAADAVTTLQAAIEQHGNASWVLAGGTTPALAYQVIASQYCNALDWSRVTILMGDERISTPTSPDNNWHAAEAALLSFIPEATSLRPNSELPADQAAIEYEAKLASLPETARGQPRLDLVWIGVGDDGHTLSLFPDHADFVPTDRLVTAVYNSPKPPADRITLTLQALEGADHCVILASGADKATAISQALSPDSQLPIAQAARITAASWFIDTSAAQRL